MSKNSLTVKKSKSLGCDEMYFQFALGKTNLKGVVLNEKRVYWELDSIAKYLHIESWHLVDLFTYNMLVKTKMVIMPMQADFDESIISMLVDHVALKHFLATIKPTPEIPDFDAEISALVALLNGVPESLGKIKEAFDAKW